MHPNIDIYIYMLVRLCVIRLYIHYPFICICENRPTLFMREPVCDGDGSAVCARGGGLVLRARPEPETLTVRAVPVGVDRVRLRRAGVPVGVGVQRKHRRVEHRARRHDGRGMRRSGPGGAHYGGRARPGLRCGAARCARARAYTCRHSLARGLGCRYGRAEGRFGACIRI